MAFEEEELSEAQQRQCGCSKEKILKVSALERVGFRVRSEFHLEEQLPPPSPPSSSLEGVGHLAVNPGSLH